MTSEITEEKEKEEVDLFINKEAQKKRIRQILEYQKSLYWSSSSSSSLCSSSSSSSSSPVASSSAMSSFNRSGRLLELMKNGNTSLRRLFDMEHTSLATHFQDYSGSPVTKTIPLWGSSETDDEKIHDPWAEFKQIGTFKAHGSDGVSNFASDGSFLAKDFGFRNKNTRIGSRRKLTRKKSFRRLPGFRFRFRLRLRLKRLRIMICGKIF